MTSMIDAMNSLNAIRLRPATTKLKKEAVTWLISLPESVRPVELAKKFPHIVNQIASLWDDFYTCEHYLHNLLHERERAYRQGFPGELISELKQLYNTLLRQALIVSASAKSNLEHAA